ncbi:TPA: phage baseplate upper protein [Enterococcus faecalis]|nr:phage baseplate upper protein [Enterococcus faecalis]
MVKWQATLSTTEPYNYIGIQNVRQGNRNTEVLEAILVENALPLDLTGCEVFFESVIDNKYPIQRAAKIVNAKKGIIQYTFDEYSMQSLHRQEAYFSIHKGDNLIGSTQNFSYFVVNAVSKTEGEMGSYWQSIEDLIADMTAFINENKGDFTDWMNARKEEFEAWRDAQKTDFTSWFESIKDILKTVDPGGTMLVELMDARVDIQGVRHNSLSERLLSDMDYLYQRLEERLFTLKHGNVSTLEILQDDSFSTNHQVKVIGSVNRPVKDGALIIATIDDEKQNTFRIEGVSK